MTTPEQYTRKDMALAILETIERCAQAIRDYANNTEALKESEYRGAMSAAEVVSKLKDE